jgi:hypothetical protein
MQAAPDNAMMHYTDNLPTFWFGTMEQIAAWAARRPIRSDQAVDVGARAAEFFNRAHCEGWTGLWTHGRSTEMLALVCDHWPFSAQCSGE